MEQRLQWTYNNNKIQLLQKEIGKVIKQMDRYSQNKQQQLTLRGGAEKNLISRVITL